MTDSSYLSNGSFQQVAGSLAGFVSLTSRAISVIKTGTNPEKAGSFLTPVPHSRQLRNYFCIKMGSNASHVVVNSDWRAHWTMFISTTLKSQNASSSTSPVSNKPTMVFVDVKRHERKKSQNLRESESMVPFLWTYM